jgi:quercetin dioxygenase-like cupin family protein
MQTSDMQTSVGEDKRHVRMLIILITLLICTIGAISVLADPASSSSAPSAKELMTRGLAANADKEVVMLTVDYPPGGKSAPHRHDAQVFVYVLEGEVEMQLQGGLSVVLRPGETFYEGPSEVHSVSANHSKTMPAKFLVLAIKDKSKPLTLPAVADSQPAERAAGPSGLHDFDFLVGTWQVHHRRLKERLVNNQEWVEFDGTYRNYPLMEGRANVDENLFNMPSGAYRGVGLRAFDPDSDQWAIWWLDGRYPFANLDPPVKGAFVDGIGTFETDMMRNGTLIRVRYVWSQITPTTAHWEQAFSPDGGKTWETNWIMDFRRVP